MGDAGRRSQVAEDPSSLPAGLSGPWGAADKLSLGRTDGNVHDGGQPPVFTLI
jgi:hypothetical protein